MDELYQEEPIKIEKAGKGTGRRDRGRYQVAGDLREAEGNRRVRRGDGKPPWHETHAETTLAPPRRAHYVKQKECSEVFIFF